MGYHDLLDEATAAGVPGRKAIAITGNNESDIKKVEEIVDRLGFDPLYIGLLANGRKLEAGGRVFGANVEKNDLRKLLAD